MPVSRNFVAGATLLALLAASACSGGGDDEKPAAKKARPDTVATWSTVKLPDEKLNRGANVSFEDALPPGPGGPYLIVGVTTPPGAPSQVTTYTSSDGTRFPASAKTLEVEGDPDVSGVVADGKRTLAYGTFWHDGAVSSWIRGTTDRKTWSEVDVPGGLAKEGAQVSSLVPLDGEDALAIGGGSKHRLVAQHLTGGDVQTLPAAPDEARYDGIEASARSGDTIVVVASAEKKDATDILVALRSTDAGKTWTVHAGPAGESPVVSGLSVVKDGFVATGWTGAAVAEAAAWATTDGSAWKADKLPRFRNSKDWPVWLGQPQVHQGKVYASVNYGEWLSGQMAVREAGRWRVLGAYANTTAPGVDAMLVPGDPGIVVARSHDGQGSIGLLRPGSYGSVSRLGTSEFTGYWDSPAAGNAQPALSYSRGVVEQRPNNGWERKTSTQHLSFQGSDTVVVSTLQPARARGLNNVEIASAADGSTVVLGNDTHNHEEQGNGDDSDIAGFFRAKGGAWRPVTGLVGPRTEQLDQLSRVGDQWIAIGRDREDYEGAAHQFGAMWTSDNGVSWKRAKGSFDADPAYDSWVSDVCLSPNGSPMVVGGTEDQARGSVPRAWRQASGSWKPLDLGGLGEGVSSVSGCVGTGKVTLLRGDAVTGSKVWRTSDLEKFEKVTIAGEDNSFGTLRQVTGGFAATGYLGEGTKSQAVLWLSRDGEEWTPVDVPGKRQLVASDMAQWGKRLIVLQHGSGGPAIASMDNFDEVLAAVK